MPTNKELLRDALRLLKKKSRAASNEDRKAERKAYGYTASRRKRQKGAVKTTPGSKPETGRGPGVPGAGDQEDSQQEAISS